VHPRSNERIAQDARTQMISPSTNLAPPYAMTAVRGPRFLYCELDRSFSWMTNAQCSPVRRKRGVPLII
jgi:hypothetical protein